MIYYLTQPKLQIVFGIFLAYGNLQYSYNTLKNRPLQKQRSAYSYNVQHIYTKIPITTKTIESPAFLLFRTTRFQIFNPDTGSFFYRFNARTFLVIRLTTHFRNRIVMFLFI